MKPPTFDYLGTKLTITHHRNAVGSTIIAKAAVMISSSASSATGMWIESTKTATSLATVRRVSRGTYRSGAWDLSEVHVGSGGE